MSADPLQLIFPQIAKGEGIQNIIVIQVVKRNLQSYIKFRHYHGQFWKIIVFKSLLS